MANGSNWFGKSDGLVYGRDKTKNTERGLPGMRVKIDESRSLRNRRVPSALRNLGTLSALLLLSGCGSVPSSISGFNPANLFYSGSVPPSRPPEEEVAECPEIEIPTGTAALRIGGDQPRVQISITNLARECRLEGDKIRISVGIEGLVLLGQNGTPGTFSAPVFITMKRGERVVASRSQSIAVTIPQNDTQASFTTVQRDFLVPKGGDDLSILVGLGSRGESVSPSPRQKKK
jgi:hypothetical protein